MHAPVVRKLGVEGRARDVALPHEDGLAAESVEDFDVRPGLEDARCTDEDERKARF
jgi:hypothetical protein